ncbi:MAG: ABC transporter ATP-binding protein/permease [Spirochaetaceae bacterium]|nr:ABC transporter ATP-binding protein/permease [Spirochaetaceae bacterium]
MSDFIESETLVKGYDGRILKRIFSYVKKYKLLVFVSLCALVSSSVGELMVPVLEQRLIDGAIMLRFIRIDRNIMHDRQLEAVPEKELSRLIHEKGAIDIGGYTFIPETAQLGLSSKIKNQCEAEGILDSGLWYAFSLAGALGNTERLNIVQEHPGLFLSDKKSAALRSNDLGKLSGAEKAVIRRDDIHAIFVVTALLLAVLLFVFIAAFIQTRTASLVGQNVMRDIRIALFEHTASLSSDFLSHNPVGRIVSRLSGDVETINEFFTSFLAALLKDFSIMTGVMITLFCLSPPLALIALVCLPPVLIATNISRKRARDAFRKQRLATSEINAYLSERLSLLSVVQLFRREEKSRLEFKERNTGLLQANLDEMLVFATFRPIVEFLSVFTTAAIIAVGANLVLSLSLSLGVLIAFIGLLAMFFSPVTDLAEKYTIFESAMAGAERVFALLDTDEKIIDHAGAGGKLDGAHIRGDVVFHNVTFSYKKGESVLKNLSFSIKRGEKVAIVGYTGAGKTTIANVLTRLWDIDSGEITLDGVNIKEIGLNTLRASVLPVLQDVFLFSGTIAENIGLGLPLSEEEIKNAAKAVHADIFIEKLPAAYNTVLSEGSVNISSGEKQLISFARVIAHNPKLVILDEATSSVDTETEGLLQDGMAKILAGRSSIVIAHRLSTIRNADRILVLSNGTLAEQGSHDELIAHNGLYALLCKLQFDSAKI